MHYLHYNAASLKHVLFIVFVGLAAGGNHDAALGAIPHGPCWKTHVAASPASEVVVIVDPFGFEGGELLPAYAESLGYQPIIVLSRPDLPSFLFGRFDRSRYPVITAESQMNFEREIRKASGGFPIRAVLPGTESGVPLTTAIAADLGLKGNSVRMATAWREKARMHEMLAEKKVEHARTGRAGNVVSAMDWIRKTVPDFPRTEIVVKPPSSAGTDRVFFCRTEAEIEHALSEIVGKADAFGDIARYAVLQERLLGDEYIVDTVSTTVGDRTFHQMVGAWRYHRRPSAILGMADVIDYVSWVPVSELPQGMANYAHEVLDALEIEFGPAHLEIMYSAERGSTLIELGARLPGGLPLLAAEVTGPEFHQIHLAWDSVLDPNGFVARMSHTEGTFPTKKEAIIVFLSVEETGKKLSHEGLGLLNKHEFATLNSQRVFGKPEQELSLTTNVTNALLRAHFVGEPDKVWEDARKLQRLHAAGTFYQ